MENNVLLVNDAISAVEKMKELTKKAIARENLNKEVEEGLVAFEDSISNLTSIVAFLGDDVKEDEADNLIAVENLISEAHVILDTINSHPGDLTEDDCNVFDSIITYIKGVSSDKTITDFAEFMDKAKKEAMDNI